MNNDEQRKNLEEELKLVERELGEMGWRNTETGQWEAGTPDIDKTATEPDEIADNIEALEENQAEVAVLTARRDDIIRALAELNGEAAQ